MNLLDQDALDGFLRETWPVPGLSLGMAPAMEEVPASPLAEDHAGSSVAAREGEGGAGEQTGGYDLIVIDGAVEDAPPEAGSQVLPTRPKEETYRQAAAASRVAEGAGVGVVMGAAALAACIDPAMVSPGVSPGAAPATPAEAPTHPPEDPAENPSLLPTEGMALPRRRGPLMAVLGMALLAAVVLLVLLAGRDKPPVSATETVSKKGHAERAPVASASPVSIPEPTPLVTSAAPVVAPTPRAEETLPEMRFPGTFDRNGSRPHDIDVAALGGILRLLRERCADGTVVVTGHTCTLGDAHANQTLSLLRARRVGDLLVRSGFGSERLQLVGQGDRQPFGDNRTLEGKRHNRRVTISCAPSPQGHPLGTPNTATPEEDVR